MIRGLKVQNSLGHLQVHRLGLQRLGGQNLEQRDGGCDLLGLGGLKRGGPVWTDPPKGSEADAERPEAPGAVPSEATGTGSWL